MASRDVEAVYTARAASDGDGVKLKRVFGGRSLDKFDPFLMLDEFGSDEAVDYMGGFPNHPHRGFETVTYMLEGRMLHEDHLGNKGLLQDGDVQWMRAGRGIIHSEMPQQVAGRMRGFQLWVNLPAAEKMSNASYRDISAENIPVFSGDGVSYKLIAGQMNIAGKPMVGAVVGLSTQALFVDIIFTSNKKIVLDVAVDHTALIYIYEGQAKVGEKSQVVNAGQLVMMSLGEGILIESTKETRLILLAGRPISEPIAQYGPFVMNTQDEIEQAIQDYRQGKLI